MNSNNPPKQAEPNHQSKRAEQESTGAEQDSPGVEQESTAAEQERQECSRREHRDYRSTEKESIIITLMAANLTRIAFLSL